MGAETIRINIAESGSGDSRTTSTSCFSNVSDKRKSAELHERQKYNYYCDRQAGCWNWTKEQDEAYQKEWDDMEKNNGDDVSSAFQFNAAIMKMIFGISEKRSAEGRCRRTASNSKNDSFCDAGHHHTEVP